MKVLVLANATYADPPTRKVFDHVAARGIEVVLAMPRRIRHPFGPSVVPPTPWETPVRLELLDTWYLHENGTHVVMKGLPGLIRRLRPDVIHCVLEPWSITCLMVASVLMTMPGYRPRLGVQPVETLPHHGTLLARTIRQSLYRMVLRRTDYFIGWSTRTIDAARMMGLNGIPTLSAPALAVDTDTFKPLPPPLREAHRSELGWGRDAFVIGFVGRFEPEKGIRDLLAAMDKAVREEPGLRLVLLGTGSLGAEVARAAASREWLSVLPSRDAAGVGRFMAAVDLLVLPSRATDTWDEQFGLVAIEAMACGTPLVASDCGSLGETVGDAGVVVPQKDVDALYRSIVGLARSQDRRADLARRGMDRISRHFAPSSLAERLMPLLVKA